MNFFDWFDFLRVATAVGLLYFGIPVLSRRLGDRPAKPWYRDLAPSFVYASLFVQITATILGNWQLCYSGLMAVLIISWILATIAFASRRRWIWNSASWRGGFLRGLEWFERTAWRRLAERYRTRRTIIELSQSVLLFCALLLIVFVNRTGFALENCRYLGAQTYERALSLQTLVHGGAWVQDGSVVLLAPIAQFSGADASVVVRFAGPVFLVLLVVAGGYCAWVYVRRLSAAFLTSLLLALYPVMLGFDSPGEAAGPELSAFYWVLAIAMLRTSPVYAIGAAANALLIHGEFTPMLAGTILCVSAAIVFSAALRFVPRFVTVPAGVAGVLCAALVLPRAVGLPAGDGPYQYETAARAADRIGRAFPRNKWMIISPPQELSSTYGRGWHLQISEFVRAHTPAQVSQPDFRFNYTVDDVFIFIEKEPLRQTARSAAMASDEYSYHYLTQMGRTTLEFQAAQLMAAYASSHPNAGIYSEDDHMLIYHVSLNPSS